MPARGSTFHAALIACASRAVYDFHVENHPRGGDCLSLHHSDVEGIFARREGTLARRVDHRHEGRRATTNGSFWKSRRVDDERHADRAADSLRRTRSAVRRTNSVSINAGAPVPLQSQAWPCHRRLPMVSRCVWAPARGCQERWSGQISPLHPSPSRAKP